MPSIPTWCWVLVNIFASVGIVLVNKLVLVEFSHPILLTLAHQIFGWIATRFLQSIHILNAKTEESISFWNGLGLGSCYALSLAFTNYSLSYNAVGTYQLLKLLSIPILGFLQYFIYSKRLTFQTVLSLLTILVGIGLVVLTDSTIEFEALILGILGTLFGSISQLWIEEHSNLKGINGLHIVSVLNPYATLSLTFICITSTLPISSYNWSSIPYSIFILPFKLWKQWSHFLVSQISLWISFPLETSIVYFEFIIQKISNLWLQSFIKDMSISITILILISCILAFIVNFVGFHLIQRISAVGYQVVGHFKLIATILIGNLVFPLQNENNTTTVLRFTELLGAFISLLGMIWYQQIRHQILLSEPPIPLKKNSDLKKKKEKIEKISNKITIK